MAVLGEGLPRGVGQEEAHEAATGQQEGHDEGGRRAVRVQERCDHHVTDDAAQTRCNHRHRYTGGTAIKILSFQIWACCCNLNLISNGLNAHLNTRSTAYIQVNLELGNVYRTVITL